jgi:hypothetical protein
MFTNLLHPSNPLLVNLIIVLAELGGVALATGLVFAIRRLRPALVRVSALRPRGLARERR